MANGPGPQQGILKLEIEDKKALYAAYMPFIKNGGLFVETTKSYRIGDEVFVLVNLVEEGERLPVPGKVVWVTPVGAEGKRKPGIGIQCSDSDGGATQKKIEAALAGMLESGQATKTM
jgi:type IV pilus assembly protein PilZ